MVRQENGNGSDVGSEREVRVLLDTYTEGRLDEEQLIDRLVQMQDIASDESKESLASGLSELVGRIEMIHLNICRAEQRHAIGEVLAEFKKRHLSGNREHGGEHDPRRT